MVAITESKARQGKQTDRQTGIPFSTCMLAFEKWVSHWLAGLSSKIRHVWVSVLNSHILFGIAKHSLEILEVERFGHHNVSSALHKVVHIVYHQVAS